MSKTCILLIDSIHISTDQYFCCINDNSSKIFIQFSYEQW